MTTLFDLPDTPAPNTPRDPATPWWVTAYETRSGAAATLAGGKAVPRPCPRCRTWCLTGYDSNLCAVQAWTDPAPLTPQLEAAALILRRTTYRLWGSPGRYELTLRLVPGVHLPGRHPSADQCTVIAAHVCNSPPLSTVQLPMSAPKSHIDHSRIPF